MPKKKNEKKEESFIDFPNDEETVIIKGKRYTVNQKPPSFELTSKYSGLVYSFKNLDEETKRAYKIIDAYNVKLDEAIIKQDIDKIIELDNFIRNKKVEASNILLGLINAFYDIIEWLLGNEAVSIIKLNANNMESLIPIFTKICIRNKYFNNVVKQSTK